LDRGGGSFLQHGLSPAVRHLLDLILPHEALDGGERPLSPGLGAENWGRIEFIEDPACDGCGLPFPYDMGEGMRCAACQARPRAFGRARAACAYDETSRDLILKLKHGDRPDLARLFARWLARSAAPLLEEADVVVPVPLHPLRLLRRRYNQAAEIARPLARSSGLRYRPGALVRRRATESQGRKSWRGRRLNVQGAFEVPPRAAAGLKGVRVLLVDDVITTGATAEACARALLQAGAASVDVCVVARVREAGNLTI
jgi:ComF family protein